MGFSASQLWMIPAFPLAAAAIGAVAPRRARGLAAGAAIGSMIASFFLSCLALRTALASPAAHQVCNFDWFDLGAGAVRIGWLLDPLTAFMCVMVTLVGTLIFIFSVGYMDEDGNFPKFFCYLSLFASAMLGVVVSNSLLLLFVSWELVGFASYILIGFWFEKPAAAAAATKAFITTRIGDLGFLLGMVWCGHNSAGSLLFYDGGHGCLESGALSGLGGAAGMGGLALCTAIGLLIFCGAIGKSGQFPLHVWLPDAMEGPTPVSALIHAATMVAAGVFLIARVYPLMMADQSLAGVSMHALTVVAFIGAITALMGSLIAVAQNDIKRVLAFSTVSQLGYMMLALGVGSWVAGIFHLLAHAFFKALLFLGAGSVIHAAHHEQDIRRMGGLSRVMRTTFATFAVGMMALSGVPFLFSGFWSKEAVIGAAHGWSVSQLPFAMGLCGVVLTAFYMTRLMGEAFGGRARTDAAGHAHESPSVMTLPLVILAVFSVLFGFLGTPMHPWLQSMLAGHPIKPKPLFEEGGLMALSILLVLVGIGTGWALYVRRARKAESETDPLAAKLPRIWRFLEGRMKFDELYAATVGRLSKFVSALSDGLDRWVWGGAVNFLALLGEFAGWVNREADEDGLNAGFNAASDRLKAAGKAYSSAQTGEIQGYLAAVALAFAVIAFLMMWGSGK